MNLHDIQPAHTADEQLLYDFFTQNAYHELEWRFDPDNPNNFQYRHPGATDGQWALLTHYNAATYLIRAQDWERRGRPRR